MLVINKVAIHFMPVPSVVLFIQLAFSALGVQIGSMLGWCEVDRLEWVKVRRFMWVVIGFLGTIYCNIKVLQNTNVETFITFRSTTPMVFTICDYVFLGRSLPNTRSWICLLLLVLGSFGYLLSDEGFNLQAYLWLCCWYIVFTFDTVYVKHMCENVKMTNWGRVYYTNYLALVPLLFIFPAMDDYSKLIKVQWSIRVLGPLLLSCVVGLAMSHASYVLRDTVSATSFTVIGIVCKVLTVIINCLLWEKHASPVGIGFLFMCVLGGSFYQQSPKRQALKVQCVGASLDTCQPDPKQSVDGKEVTN